MKKSIVIFSIIFIAIAFASISILVFFNKGKNTKLIAKKIKVGALLITFTSVFSACPVVSCYAPIHPDQVYINEGLNASNQIDLSQNNILRGEIYERESANFTFTISKQDSNNEYNIFQKDFIMPKDGIFDSSSEEIYLSLDTNISPGNYTLSFHNKDTSMVQEPALDNMVGIMQIEIL